MNQSSYAVYTTQKQHNVLNTVYTKNKEKSDESLSLTCEENPLKKENQKCTRVKAKFL